MYACAGKHVIIYFVDLQHMNFGFWFLERLKVKNQF